jgi:integrase
VPVLVHLGAEALNVFKDLPAEGMLFPYLSRVRAGDRATEFGQRCRQLGISGSTWHSYRYAWAERAKTAGMPERFAQEALGHNSKGCASRPRQTRPHEHSVTGRLREEGRMRGDGEGKLIAS